MFIVHLEETERTVSGLIIGAAFAVVVAKSSKKNKPSHKQPSRPSDRLEAYLKLMEAEDLHELEISDGPFLVKLVREPKPSFKPHSTTGAPPDLDQAPARLSKDEPFEGAAIKAPLGGVFYRAPSPKSPPFVKESDAVTPGQTLCIIEAMKVMNEIKADQSGRILRILVENGKSVEPNQTLFLLAPSE